MEEYPEEQEGDRREQGGSRSKVTNNHLCQTRPSSDSEAATMHKLKGQSSNMRTGSNMQTAPSSWSVKVHF